MKVTHLMAVVGIVLVLALGGAYLFSGGGSVAPEVAQALPGGNTVTLYKSPNCGCCGNYVAYLERNGYAVDVVETNNMDQVKEERGIPESQLSCHTTLFGNYVVEGHMPLEAVEALFAEQPNMRGIALAGMPAGSPGMPGAKRHPFSVHAITSDGADGGIFLKL